MIKDLDKLQKVIGYDFNDSGILRQALIHPSYSGEMRMQRYESNQRLEFLGDAVLELVVSEYLYKEHPQIEEGELTRKRSSLVFEAALNECAKLIGLGDFIYLGRGEDMGQGREKPSILSDTFEAVIGAIYLDGGFEAAKQFIHSFVINNIQEMSLLRDGKSLIRKLSWSIRQRRRMRLLLRSALRLSCISTVSLYPREGGSPRNRQSRTPRLLHARN